MRFSDARKRDVVATDTAETIGRVDALVVDPERARVSAVRLAKVDGDDPFVSFDDLVAFGQDVVTVPSADVLRGPLDDRERGVAKDYAVLGKRVLDDSGREHGEVQDVEFDPEDGAVRALVTGRGEIAGGRLLGVGSYAVIVTRAPAQQ